MLLTRAPLYRGRSPFSCDLHVLGAPLTFVLSQDQTLQLNLSSSQIAASDGDAQSLGLWLWKLESHFGVLAPKGCRSPLALSEGPTRRVPHPRVRRGETLKCERTIQFSRTEEAEGFEAGSSIVVPMLDLSREARLHLLGQAFTKGAPPRRRVTKRP